MKTGTQGKKLSFMCPAMMACGIVVGLVSAQGLAQQAVSKATPVVQAETATSQPVSLAASVPLGALMPGISHDEPAPTPKGPGKEGIRVHGHWVIDVKNPDGTVVEHRDFQNSLTSGGAAGTSALSSGDQVLVALLSGNGVPSTPSITFFEGQNGVATLNAARDTSVFCVDAGITCGKWGTANSFFTSTTGLNFVANFSPAANLVLSGNYTVPPGLTGIDAVQTVLVICTGSDLGSSASHPAMNGSAAYGTGTVAPNGCYNGNPNIPSGLDSTLTYTLVNNNAGVPTRLVVTPGQILSVIVTISFS